MGTRIRGSNDLYCFPVDSSIFTFSRRGKNSDCLISYVPGRNKRSAKLYQTVLSLLRYCPIFWPLLTAKLTIWTWRRIFFGFWPRKASKADHVFLPSTLIPNKKTLSELSIMLHSFCNPRMCRNWLEKLNMAEMRRLIFRAIRLGQSDKHHGKALAAMPRETFIRLPKPSILNTGLFPCFFRGGKNG